MENIDQKHIMKNINQFKSAFEKKIKDNSFCKTDIVNIFCGKLN